MARHSIDVPSPGGASDNGEDGDNGKTQSNGVTEQEQRGDHYSSLLRLCCSASLCFTVSSVPSVWVRRRPPAASQSWLAPHVGGTPGGRWSCDGSQGRCHTLSSCTDQNQRCVSPV